jgi:hypothetical protein
MGTDWPLAPGCQRSIEMPGIIRAYHDFDDMAWAGADGHAERDAAARLGEHGQRSVYDAGYARRRDIGPMGH